MSGVPVYEGQTGRSWGHSLVAVEGLFDTIVWECSDCREVRTKKEFYQNVDCR